LEGFDYSTPGAYFITICVKAHENLFWNVGARIARLGDELPLSELGIIADKAISEIPMRYPEVKLDKYVVMPNHIHLLLCLSEGGRAMRAPTISTVVNQLKGTVTKRAERMIWQKSFHDHIVRGEKDYLEIWEYIESNPWKWTEDCFYNKKAEA
jgi:putative transposase